MNGMIEGKVVKRCIDIFPTYEGYERERERERDRQTDRQTDRQRKRETNRV